jgi:quercetin dioxygenase-like cupin family protein
MNKWLVPMIAGLAALPASAQPKPASDVSQAVAAVTLPAAHVDKTAPEKAIRHIGGSELASALNSKKPTDALTEVLLSQGAQYRVSNTLRDRNGVVEFHEFWYDHIFVQEGEGSFLTGGTMVGAVDTAAGEKRAVSITGGTSTPLRAGDYFMVPPHVPHQMLVAKGQQLRFVVFKIRK